MLDARDQEILDARYVEYVKTSGPRVGDFVIFADDVKRRISHVWPEDWEMPDIQTSDQGSFYLGNGHVSFSGGLRPPVHRRTLTQTNDYEMGRVWFFHHDVHRAHNGVDAQLPFRIFTCTEDAP